ncbi:hypothetical protein [Flavobacterium caseinilyticum]|nr:hypothetical protein [Flavobacterium caseinilyticum]
MKNKLGEKKMLLDGGVPSFLSGSIGSIKPKIFPFLRQETG